MSFILDALKKADTERRLGELPGIHSRSLPAAETPRRAPFLQRRSTWALAALPIIALATWFTMQFKHAALNTHAPVQLTRDAPTGAALAPPSLALAPATSLAPPPAARDRATAASVAGEIPVPPPSPAPAPRTARPVPVAVPSVARTANPADTEKKSVAVVMVPATKPAIKTADRTLESAATSGLMADLPPNLQREIPKLAIAGSIYSANPADRMLLIDKRMLHEGDEISPGLVLETVMPKAATLRYKGYAFRVVF